MKKFIVVSNWKQNGSRALLEDYRSFNYPFLRIIVCPPFPLLIDAATLDSCDVGAQNVSQHADGAYTGEVGAPLLKEVKVAYCLVGHSERRHHAAETPIILREKLLRLLEGGIEPIYCVGENEEEYAAGETESSIEKQLEILGHPSLNNLQSMFIAYEPVWSIGSGAVASIEHITLAFSVIKKTIDQIHKRNNSRSYFHVRMLYGGSVSDKNISAVMSVPDIDGVLIGGMSLQINKLHIMLTRIEKHMVG